MQMNAYDVIVDILAYESCGISVVFTCNAIFNLH